MHEMPRVDASCVGAQMSKNIRMVFGKKCAVIMQLPTKDMGTLFLTPYPKAPISIDQRSLPEPAAIETIGRMWTALHTIPETVKNIRNGRTRRTLPRTKKTTSLPYNAGANRKTLLTIATTPLLHNGRSPSRSCCITTEGRAIDLLLMAQHRGTSIEKRAAVSTMVWKKLYRVLRGTLTFLKTIQRWKIVSNEGQFKRIELINVAGKPCNPNASRCSQSPMQMMITPAAANMPRTANIEDTAILMETEIDGTQRRQGTIVGKGHRGQRREIEHGSPLITRASLRGGEL